MNLVYLCLSHGLSQPVKKVSSSTLACKVIGRVAAAEGVVQGGFLRRGGITYKEAEFSAMKER